jgi:hypothetical protein
LPSSGEFTPTTASTKRCSGVSQLFEIRRLGGHQAREVAQVEDQSRLPDEEQMVAAVQHGGGRNGRDRIARALDLDEEHAFEMAQARGSDGLAGDRSAGIDDHPHHEVALGGTQVASRRAALGQQQGRCDRDHDDPQQRHRQPDMGDLEEPERCLAGVLEQTRDDQVGRRPDRGDHTAEDHAERERHQES